MGKTTKRQPNLFDLLLLALIVPLLGCSGLLFGASRIGRANMPFKEKATGGTLVLGYVPSPHYVHIHSVSIDTSSGESAESVVDRLAGAVVSSGAIFKRGSQTPGPGRMAICTAQGSTLSIMGSVKNYLLAGTESGLGIPKPPLSLSCAYDEQARTIEVKWINPQDDCGYDSLYLRWRYRSIIPDTPVSGGAKVIAGKPTSYTIKIPQEVNDLDMDVWLKGLRHDVPVGKMLFNSVPLTTNTIPSNVAAIHVTSGGHCQEETYGVPFSFGVAPNWTGWSTDGEVDKTVFQQGEKYAGVRWYEPVNALLTKPFYQIIKAPPKGVAHGVCREFLGLTPGHTYRLSACLSTLNMDSAEGNWSLVLCAAPVEPGAEPITPEQLAGRKPLPDGRSGPQAGQIAMFSRGNTTKGKFQVLFSKAEEESALYGSHVTLSPGVDSLSVWTRFECEDPNGEVGISGIRLEDLTAIANPKTVEQILDEEAEAEKVLLRHAEKTVPQDR